MEAASELRGERDGFLQVHRRESRVSSEEIDRRCAALTETKRLLGERLGRSGPAPTMTLDDLTDRFQVVATSSVSSDGDAVWAYLVDRQALQEAQAKGSVVTGQTRLADGIYELKAKRCRGRV